MKPSRLAARVAVCTLFLSAITLTARSQAFATASKSQEISAFGAAMGGSTDLGGRSYLGASAGADYTFFLPRGHLAVSFEIRGGELLGSETTEKTVQFGPRIQRDFGQRYHPYVDFLYGGGVIQFHPRATFQELGYTGDRGRAASFGGGIDIDLAHHLGAKFDIQGQEQKFGGSIFTAPGQNLTISPVVISVGVVYTVPFRTRNRRGDFH